MLRIKLKFGNQINMVLTNIAVHHFAKKNIDFVQNWHLNCRTLTKAKPSNWCGSIFLSPTGENTHINPPINLKIMMATTDWLVAHSTLKVASSRKPYTSSRFRPYVSDRKPQRKAEVIIPAEGKETEEEMMTNWRTILRKALFIQRLHKFRRSVLGICAIGLRDNGKFLWEIQQIKVETTI